MCVISHGVIIPWNLVLGRFMTKHILRVSMNEGILDICSTRKEAVFFIIPCSSYGPCFLLPILSRTTLTHVCIIHLYYCLFVLSSSTRALSILLIPHLLIYLPYIHVNTHTFSLTHSFAHLLTLTQPHSLTH
jgi:hypothetical protein